ncbi:hypothetical protein H6P81_006120 [Aristolochia fimbriata]|uniref:Uncharacterized protein n=1 Tax=Aristolochia fimbriata TaxID=158543 RepID=A0AAV7EXL4_ARIFI|nr:hypothetical protein H6P81_006120 [Aristolochia fimbriata]
MAYTGRTAVGSCQISAGNGIEDLNTKWTKTKAEVRRSKSLDCFWFVVSRQSSLLPWHYGRLAGRRERERKSESISGKRLDAPVQTLGATPGRNFATEFYFIYTMFHALKLKLKNGVPVMHPIASSIICEWGAMSAEAEVTRAKRIRKRVTVEGAEGCQPLLHISIVQICGYGRILFRPVSLLFLRRHLSHRLENLESEGDVDVLEIPLKQPSLALARISNLAVQSNGGDGVVREPSYSRKMEKSALPCRGRQLDYKTGLNIGK